MAGRYWTGCSGAVSYTHLDVYKRQVVSAAMNTGVRIAMDNPKQVGADLIVDATAVLHEYPQPTLFFDMGTATTVSAIDQDGAYVGGMIIAGAELSLEALSNGCLLYTSIRLILKKSAIVVTVSIIMWLFLPFVIPSAPRFLFW